MKILIDIGHPAHVHYFKNFTKIMCLKHNEVLFTCRDKDVTIELLKYYQFDYISFGKTYTKLSGKLFGLFWFTLRLLLISLKYKPDIILNATFYGAFVARILRKPHISIEDTFNKESTKLFMPFTNVVLTGNYPHPSLGEKEVKYAGYQELMYLHPNFFTADKNVLKLLGLNEDEKYVILRFVAWKASHDFGHKGISYENKVKAIIEFGKYAKVFISSESELPKELQRFKINIPSQKLHDALAYATLLWAESFTMPSECSMLGTPSIINHNSKSFYLFEQENKYGLCFNFTESEKDQQKAIEKGIELLKSPDLKEVWQKKRQKLLYDKIDVTAFLVWFVENYPNSFKIMKGNPDYQLRFK